MLGVIADAGWPLASVQGDRRNSPVGREVGHLDLVRILVVDEQCRAIERGVFEGHALREAAALGRGEQHARAGRARAGKRGRRAAPEPEPTEHELDVTFLTAVRGGTERVRMNVGGQAKTIDVTIPRGIANGTRLRVGADGAELILVVRVGQHPVFRRTEVVQRGLPEGLDLYLDLPLTIAEATLGATVTVPTLGAPIEVSVPPGTASGKKLRLRGKGIENAHGGAGDLYAIIKSVPPPSGSVTAQEGEMLRAIAERGPSPRSGPDWPKEA